MKKYTLISTLISAAALATPAFADDDEITIKFVEQNSPAQTSGVAWTVNDTAGYYVGTTISSDEIEFAWGALTNGSGSEPTIMNQNEHPLDEGTVIPYNTTTWTLSFTITATEAIEISSIAFQFVGDFNGGSFTNSKDAVNQFDVTLTTGTTEVTTLYSNNVSIYGTSLEAVEGAETNETYIANYEANYIVMNFDTISLEANESITFTLTVNETDGNSVRAGIQSIVVGVAPEPSMFGLMFGLGAIGLVATRRRRR